MKRTLIPLLALGALVVASVALADRPNVLLITSDDQGFCELGAYADFADPETMGAAQIEKWREITEVTPNQAPIEVCMKAAAKCMPNMDGLAKRGLRFTDFHAAPTCGPSRAALMSSRYPQSFGAYTNDEFEGDGCIGVPVGMDLPVELFQSAGYLTGLSGKWHLGKEPGQLPHERGFDFFFGFDRAHVEKYGSERLLKNGKPTPAVGWLAAQITDEAIEFLGMAEAQKKPFFLYVAYNEPHGPMPDPPQQYMDAINSGSKNVDGYFGMIYGMDAGIGRILEKLDAMGELDNTTILYGSDNGQARGPYVNTFGMKPGRLFGVPVPGNGPLQGCKWTPWEGGVRVPFIVKMPGGVTGSSDVLVSMLDVMPTLLDFADIEIPESMELDGRSFLPVLKGNDLAERPMFWASDSQKPFIDHWPAGLKVESWDNTPSHIVDIMPTLLEISGGEYPKTIRGNKVGKMVGISLAPLLAGQKVEREDPLFYSYVGSNGLWDGRYKLVSNRGGPWELFDMDSDPVENVDIAAAHPERVKTMSEEWYRIGNQIKVHAKSRAPRNDTATPWGRKSSEEHPDWKGKKPPLSLPKG